ncbi:MAG: hypothetical protein HY964_06690 [Ignavibacteriales bacterium]|nr:hypothetical protein [Ignavibacteriales bacterium]
MKNFITIFQIILIFIIYSIRLFSQDQLPKSDTTMLPKLEIPEITIVGKKAITLPFARKGEIYDYNIYEAPAPDSTLIGERTGTALPLGTLPRYDESFVPFHLSAEGLFGSYATLGVKVFADYKKSTWGIYGNGNFAATNGHVKNAGGNSLDLNLKGHSLVKTDNLILGSFRTIGGLNIYHDSYGLYGVHSTKADRSRSSVRFSAEMHSVERENNSLDINLSTVIWSVKDKYPQNQFSSSTVSPEFMALHSLKLWGVRFQTQLDYQSSSFNYNIPVQTSSFINLLMNAQWNLNSIWKLEIGGTIGQANFADGGSRNLIRPTASLNLQLDKDRRWSFWYKPEISFQSYHKQMISNPFFMRQIITSPETKPFVLGSSFWYNSEHYTVEFNGSAAIHTGMPVQVATLEMIDLEYVDAEQFVFNVDGTFHPTEKIQLNLSGVVQPTFKKGTSDQIPMIPLIKIGAKGEMPLSSKFNAWSGIEFWSRQNGVIDGSIKLKERILLNAGLTTTVLPHTFLSFELSNILNRNYEWWSGYRAPGISFLLNAKVNIR